MIYEVLSAFRCILLWSTTSHTSGLLLLNMSPSDLLQGKVLPLETHRNLTAHSSHNAIIIVPNSQYKYTDLDHHINIYSVLDLYSLIPTGDEDCGESRQLVLVNQWFIKGDGRFLTKRNLFPNRTPKDIQGCTVTVLHIHSVHTAQFFFFKH
jgi:hypothetical protein